METQMDNITIWLQIQKKSIYAFISRFFLISYLVNNNIYYDIGGKFMGTYNLPRDVKGEGRILFLFSAKGLITTFIGGAVGLIFYFIFSAIGLGMVGIIVTLIFAAIGYAIGMLKVPNANGLEITRKTGGESIYDVIIRYIKFKMNKKKYYIYTKEEK